MRTATMIGRVIGRRQRAQTVGPEALEHFAIVVGFGDRGMLGHPLHDPRREQPTELLRIECPHPGAERQLILGACTEIRGQHREGDTATRQVAERQWTLDCRLARDLVELVGQPLGEWRMTAAGPGHPRAHAVSVLGDVLRQSDDDARHHGRQRCDQQHDQADNQKDGGHHDAHAATVGDRARQQDGGSQKSRQADREYEDRRQRSQCEQPGDQRPPELAATRTPTDQHGHKAIQRPSSRPEPERDGTNGCARLRVCSASWLGSEASCGNPDAGL